MTDRNHSQPHCFDEILSAWLQGRPSSITTPLGLCIEVSDPLPLFGFALHAGEAIRPELQPKLNLNRKQLLKEEDPRTDDLIKSLPNRIVPLFSRFECDLNRPRMGRPVEDAVYTEPDLAWGLQVWREPLTRMEIDRSLESYHEFYSLVESICRAIRDRFGYGIFIDMHSYNIRKRTGLPDIHLGTRHQSRERFGIEIDRFIRSMEAIHPGGKPLSIAENDEQVGFYGGKLNRWVAEHFDSILVLSIEMKKFFMEEDEGVFDEPLFSDFSQAVNSALLQLVKEVRERIGAAED